MMRNCVICCGLLLASLAGILRAEEPTQQEVTMAMKRAAEFYREQVASHGGYVYFYSPDLKQRFGEGVASEDQIWVQPPGTPTVGLAYLEAYRATGDKWYLDAATETAEALLYGQLVSGGWTNCIDFNPRGQRVALYRNGKGRGRNYSSLDDDQTQAAIRFLMQMDQAYQFQHPAIHQGVVVALDALLLAQFDNGAFPQVWEGPVDKELPRLKANFPEYDWRTEGRIKQYWDLYTLNDGLAGSVAQVLIEAETIYKNSRYAQALQKLGDFLLLAQLPEPQPAWAQQYNYQMNPVWARKFEPAAVASRESQDVIHALLLIYQHTRKEKYLEPIPKALDYLQRSLLEDGKLARYYELQTNRPLYMERRGKVYSLTYSDANLPDHYGWKSKPKLKELRARYEAAKRGEFPQAKQVSTEKVKTVLSNLDSQGRWVNTFQGESLVGDQRFRPGDRYISSEVFSENLTLLSKYLERLK